MEQQAGIGKAAPVGCANAGDDGPGVRIDHVTQRVDRDDRGDDETVRHVESGRAQSAFHGSLISSEFPDGRAGAGPDRPSVTGASVAATAAWLPHCASGRTFGLPPTPRSIRTAAGTIGTVTGIPCDTTLNPMPRSSR